METPDDPPSARVHAARNFAKAADASAWGDISASRVIESDAVVLWLGGWHLARADVGSSITGEPRSGLDLGSKIDVTAHLAASRPPAANAVEHAGRSGAHGPPLMWTATAVAECDRLRQTLATLGRHTEDRLVAALVGVMVRLIVEGPDRPDGVFDITLLPTLALRVAYVDGRMIVIGPRSTEAIL